MRDHVEWSFTKRGRYDRVDCALFSKKTIDPFLFHQRPIKSNCTVRGAVIVNNETDLALTIHFQLPNTKYGLHVNSLVCLWHELCSKFYFEWP